MNGHTLLPWEGEDELAEAKAEALAAQLACLANGGRPVETAVQSDASALMAYADTQEDTFDATDQSGLPEIGAFVRTLGGLNSVAIFKDLVAADLMVYRAGRYQQRVRKAGDAEWFRSVKAGRVHVVYVTPAGQDILRQLNRDGKLTKALTKQPLTPRQKRAREKARKVAMEKREMQQAALVANRAAVLSKLDQTIENCIERRAGSRARQSTVGMALYQRARDEQHNGEVRSE